MKKKNIIKLCGIAALLIAQSAQATTLTTVTNGSSVANGDLLLAVNNSSGIGNDLLIDLGPYAGLNNGGTLDISADLTAAGLSGANLYYGIFAVTDSKIIYASTPTKNLIYGDLNSPSTAIAKGNYLQPLGVGGAYIGTLGYDLLYSYQNTAHGGYISSADINSWTTQNPNVVSGPGFGFSQYAVEAQIGSVNYLDTTQTTGTGSQVGGFNLTSGGTLSFNAVPEPSTYALFAFGGLLLVIVYRRKTA